MPFVTIPQVARRLHAPYQRCWHVVVAGKVPCERHGARYLIDEANVAKLAAALGLEPPPTEPASKPERAA